MTSNMVKVSCVKCEENKRTTLCYGCQQTFCTKHLTKHRMHLSHEMEELKQKQAVFQQDLDRESFDQSFRSIIDAWECKSIRKIQRNADKARQNLQEWLHRTKTEIKQSLNQINQQAQSSEKSDNYTELDLRKWTKQLGELRSLLEQPSTISIEEEERSSSVRLIAVVHKQAASNPSLESEQLESSSQNSASSVVEHFVKMFGPCILSKDHSVVTHSTNRYRAGLSQISGINRYSSGRHSIQFLIGRKSEKNMFIGILSSSHQVISPTFDYSVHGWWNLNHTIINGESKEESIKESIQSGDEITLIIDCDQQQIQLEHHRTKRLVHIPVKLDVCPVPWKILIRLLAADDSISIHC